MPYNSLISRADAAALIPEQVATDIIGALPQTSVVMRLGRRLPDMARHQSRIFVLSALVQAYFVTGDTGLKQTSEANWANKYINAEELAVIIPIPESVLDDAEYDIWGEIRPQIKEAFGAAFDGAAILGTNAPANWPPALVPSAIAAGHSVALGANHDLYDDLLGESGVIAKIEEDGFTATGHVAALTMRSRLRGLRDDNGNPIFTRSMQVGSTYELDGAPIEFPTNGAMDASQALLLSGDWSKLVYAIRKDISYKILTESVIQDASGNIVYNLAQQDMVALRAVMRLGWQLPNPVNRVQATEGGVVDGVNIVGRYPFTVLTPAA